MNNIPTCAAGDIAQRQKHAVAVVYRENQLTGAHDANETWSATFVGHGRPPARIHGGQEEHGQAFNERLVVRLEFSVRHRFQTVGQPPAVMLVLEGSMRLVIELAQGPPPAAVVR